MISFVIEAYELNALYLISISRSKKAPHVLISFPFRKSISGAWISQNFLSNWSQSIEAVKSSINVKIFANFEPFFYQSFFYLLYPFSLVITNKSICKQQRWVWSHRNPDSLSECFVSKLKKQLFIKYFTVFLMKIVERLQTLALLFPVYSSCNIYIMYTYIYI